MKTIKEAASICVTLDSPEVAWLMARWTARFDHAPGINPAVHPRERDWISSTRMDFLTSALQPSPLVYVLFIIYRAVEDRMQYGVKWGIFSDFL